MKITRDKLRQLILEELSTLNEREVGVIVVSGDADTERLNRSFGEERKIKPDPGESLEFIVTRDSVTSPNGSVEDVKLVDAVRRRLATYGHIPDGVELTVTYSN